MTGDHVTPLHRSSSGRLGTTPDEETPSWRSGSQPRRQAHREAQSRARRQSWCKCRDALTVVVAFTVKYVAIGYLVGAGLVLGILHSKLMILEVLP